MYVLPIYTCMLLLIIICSNTSISLCTSHRWIKQTYHFRKRYCGGTMIEWCTATETILTHSHSTRLQCCEVLKSERFWESYLQGSDMWRLTKTWCSVLTGNLWGSVHFVDQWQLCARLKLLIMCVCVYVWGTAVNLVDFVSRVMWNNERHIF